MANAPKKLMLSIDRDYPGNRSTSEGRLFWVDENVTVIKEAAGIDARLSSARS